MSTQKASIFIMLFGLLWVAGTTYAYVNTMRLRADGVFVTATYVPDEENPENIKKSTGSGSRGTRRLYYVGYHYLDRAYQQKMIGKSTQGSIIPSPYRHIPQPGEEVSAIVDPQDPKKIYYAPYITGWSIWVFIVIAFLITFGGLIGAIYARNKGK